MFSRVYRLQPMTLRNGVQVRRVLQSVVLHLLIVAAAILVGFPFFYMVTTSFKTLGEVYTIPIKWLPDRLMWQNYVDAWTLVPFGRFTMNSLIYTVTITLGELAMGVCAGYAFGRLRFPKKDLLFFVVLLTFMIPGQVTLIPRFILLKELQWINTYPGLIVPELSSAFATFLLREHFRSLPDELFDAAKIDGAGYFRQMVQVALPLSKPITVTLMLLATVHHWNAYLWPLVVTNTLNMRTLPIGLQFLRGMETIAHWHVVSAGATLVVAPLVILFLFTQKQFIAGAIQGAVKG